VVQITATNHLKGTIPTKLGGLANLTALFLGKETENVLCGCIIRFDWLTN
jgi:hypothetical protein